MATKKGGRKAAADLAAKVVAEVETRFIGDDAVPGVEDVQDIVERVLMEGGYPEVARIQYFAVASFYRNRYDLNDQEVMGHLEAWRLRQQPKG